MVSATIHLANKDWNALIDDFISLNFLPRNPDRGLIIPVMDRVSILPEGHGMCLELTLEL